MQLQSLSLVTPPPMPPISRAAAKAHLRVDGDDENDVIDALIQAATDRVSGRNGFTGRALVPQTWDYYLPFFPANGVICIPLPPLRSVTSITYRDSAGTTQTLSAGLYTVNPASEPGTVELVYGQSWPETFSSWDAVKIRFNCGYAPADPASPSDLASGVPEAIKTAIKLFLTDLYENRSAQSSVKLEENIAAMAILLSYKTNLGL